MLKQKLKEALKKAGLNEGLAEFISVTEESQIEGIVNSIKSTQSSEGDIDFNQVLGSQQFSEYVAKNGFDNLLKISKTLQSEHDKKVTAGIKSFQDKYFKKIGGEDDDPNGKGGEPNGDDVPAWAKTLIDKVEGIEKSKTTESKMEQAKKALKESKIIPEKLQTNWVSRIDLESETSFEDQIKNLETEYKEIHTGIVGSESGKGLPSGGQQTGEASDAEVDAVVDDIV